MDFQVYSSYRRIVMFLFVNGEESLYFYLLMVKERYVSGSPCYLFGSIFIWVWISLCSEHVALSLLDPCSFIFCVSYILVLWMCLGITSSNFRIGQF